jgi:mRNA interferase MazF
MGIGGHLAARIIRGRIARGEVRLYQFAAPDKKRPALVLTRDSAIAYLSTVTVAPVTSTIRGVPSEVVLNEEDGMKSACAVNLHNAVTVSQQRLGRRVAQLSSARMRCALLCGSRWVAIRISYGNDPCIEGSALTREKQNPEPARLSEKEGIEG